METDRGETLGQFLKRDREERLVSIRAAARALGVEPLQIEALEAEDDRAFPDGDTLRVVLGLYAKFLLLDEAQLLQRMGRTRSRRHREPRSVFPKQEKPPRPRWALPRIIGWVVGVALLLAGVYVLVWAPSELVRKEEGQVMRYLAPEPLRPAPAPTGAKIVGNTGQQALPPAGDALL
jgi:cytoskeletal protein RodZ